MTTTNNKLEQKIKADFIAYFGNEPKEIKIEKKLKSIIIAELKQKKISRTSKFYQAVKELHIRNVRISKYCTGILLTNKNLKYNNQVICTKR